MTTAGGRTITARQVFANVAPAVLDRLRGRTASGPGPEGAQVKINMLLSRLPRLRDRTVRPEDAFAGTFHVNEGYEQLEAAYRQASAGVVPELAPCEIYCHSLTDPTILAPELRAAGVQTLTLFGLHMPARLFRQDPPGALAAATGSILRSLDSVLDEPIADCLVDPSCLEVMGPLEIEANLGMPGGNIFHRDLQWPFAERRRATRVVGASRPMTPTSSCAGPVPVAAAASPPSPAATPPWPHWVSDASRSRLGRTSL